MSSGFVRIPHWLIHTDLSDSGLRLLVFLRSMWPCYPGFRHITEKTGLSSATIDKAIKELEAAGILQVRRGGFTVAKGLRKSSNYHVLDEDDWSLPCDVRGRFKNWYQLPNEPARSKGLTGKAVRLITIISMHADCVLRYRDLQKLTGYTRETLGRHLGELEQRGIVTIRHGGLNRGRNHYELTDPSSWDLSLATGSICKATLVRSLKQKQSNVKTTPKNRTLTETQNDFWKTDTAGEDTVGDGPQDEPDSTEQCPPNSQPVKIKWATARRRFSEPNTVGEVFQRDIARWILRLSTEAAIRAVTDEAQCVNIVISSVGCLWSVEKVHDYLKCLRTGRPDVKERFGKAYAVAARAERNRSLYSETSPYLIAV